MTGMIDTAVLIVGGGPAGAACAWRLHRSGVHAVVLDKSDFPREKLCAGWITPQLLEDLDLTPDRYPHGMRRFSRLNFYVFGFKIPVKTRQYAIRRYEFDHWLIKRSNAPIYHHHVRDIQKKQDTYIVDGRFRCRYIVGAGGTNCPVRRKLFPNISARQKSHLIVTMEKEYQAPFTDTSCHLFFFENRLPGYSWYVPKKDGYLNIGTGGKYIGIRKRGMTIGQHWALFCDKLLQDKLITRKPDRVKGYSYYLKGDIPFGRQGNAFITGDAAGLATVDMGEGIGPAVRSGILSAEAIISGCDYSPHAIRKFSIPGIIASGVKRR